MSRTVPLVCVVLVALAILIVGWQRPAPVVMTDIIACGVEDSEPPPIAGTPLSSPITVPLALHIIVKSDDTGDVSDEEIDDQIDALNASYAQTNFEFEVALISRTVDDDLFTSGTPSELNVLALDPAHLVNVYINGGPGTTLGRASFPWLHSEGSPSHFVNLHYSTLPDGTESLASGYDDGIAFPHEVGHYFGLEHPFNLGLAHVDKCTDNDEIPDTGESVFDNDTLLGECPLADICTNDALPDPWDNYMHSTSDACRDTWTPNQKDTMNLRVAVHRPSLGGSTIFIDDDLEISSSQSYRLAEASLSIDSSASIVVSDGAKLTTSSTSLSGGGDLRMETSTTSELTFSGESYIAFDSMFVSGDVHFAPDTTTFDGTVMHIPDGDTVIVDSLATVFMDGTEADPTRFLVDGYFLSMPTSLIKCAGRYSEIIGEEGVDYDLMGEIDMNCPFACLMTRDGSTMTIGSDFSVADSGLIAIKTGGTFVINDTVTVDYTSAVKPVIQKGARIEIGDDALLRIDVDNLVLEGDPADPIEIVGSGNSNAGIIELLGSNQSLEHVEIEGAQLVIGGTAAFGDGIVLTGSTQWASVLVDEGATLDVLEGSTVEMEGSYTKIHVESEYGLDVEEGVTFEMGHKAHFIFSDIVSISGTYEDPIRFEAIESERWNYLRFEGDGSSLNYAVLDGGEKNIDIQAKEVTLSHIRSKNGWRGISSYYARSGGRSSFDLEHSVVENSTSVGVVAWHSDPEIMHSTIQNNAQAGLYLYDAVADYFYDTLVTGNADVSTTRDGIEVVSGGSLIARDGWSRNRIADNNYHEIEVSSGADALLFGEYGSDGTHNTITQAGGNDYLGGEKYVVNNASVTAWVEENYWGGTPAAIDFGGSGTIEYGYDLGSDYATGAGPSGGVVPTRVGYGPEATPVLAEFGAEHGSSTDQAPMTSVSDADPVRSQMVRLRNLIQSNPDGRDTHRHLRDLFAFQLADRTDELGERQTNMNVIDAARSRWMDVALNGGPDSESDRNLQVAGETAILLQIRDALLGERYGDATDIVDAFGSFIDHETHRGELLLGRISLLEHERLFEEALVLFDEFRQLQPVRDGLFGELDIMEEMLTSMIDETAREDARADAAEPLFETGKSIREADDAVADLVVGSPYPNPFRGNAVVPFTLPASAHVEISAYDAIGKRVAVLIHGSLPTGRHRAVFSAAALPSGVYFIRAVVELDGASAQTFVSKVVLAR